MKNKINKMAKGIIQKIHDKTGYILDTTREDRKEDRRARKSLRRANRLRHLADWRPFDWTFVRKMSDRNYEINGELQGLRRIPDPYDEIGFPLPE